MKKIINGKRYDTDTAKYLASWSNMDSVSDFHYYCETLFQKRTGEFFLHGEGNGLTKYAEACGTNSWSSGQRLMPMTVDEAKAWAEEHLDGDEYEAIFGEVDEGESGEVKNLHLALDTGLVEKAKRLAGQEGLSLPAWIEKTIREA